MSWTGTIPIYINNYNLLTWPRALAEFFAEVSNTEIIFIDNASTYEPLLDWYATNCPYRVIRLQTNCGHHAAWTQSAILLPHVHRGLFGSDYYVVTDPDLDFERCPKDVLEVLIEGFCRYPNANKIGVRLEVDDVPENSLVGKQAKRWERKFWRDRFDAQFYKAGIDTTFALYSIDTPHRQAMQCNHNALRSDRPYTARHLPWYLDSESLLEEQTQYFRAARCGMWTKTLRSITIDASQDCDANELFGLSSLDIDFFDPDWRISDEMLRVLSEILRIVKPSPILETGAGASSLLFYYYQRAMPDTVYLSHDESGHWNDFLKSHVARLGFPASNIIASALAGGFYQKTAPGIEKHKPYNLILFDGPSTFQSRASEKSRQFLLENGDETSIWIIDDTNRPRVGPIVDVIKSAFDSSTFHVFSVRDRKFAWRVSTILVPEKKLLLLHDSALWRKLVSPVSVT